MIIRAEIIGSETCTAEGITAKGHAPILALCRKLIEAGRDPGTRLECYRGDTLCLTVRTLAEGADLSIDENGPTLRAGATERMVALRNGSAARPRRGTARNLAEGQGR